MDPNTTLIAALLSHQYLVSLGALILSLIGLCHLPAVAAYIQTWPRLLVMAVPFILALAGTEGQALVQGLPWLPALESGAITGLFGFITIALPCLLTRVPDVPQTRIPTIRPPIMDSDITIEDRDALRADIVAIKADVAQVFADMESAISHVRPRQ